MGLYYFVLFNMHNMSMLSISFSQNRYVVFDFFRDRPRSLLTIPESWIVNENMCYWPEADSIDEK